MIIAWLFFPLVMVAVCTGCGLLVEWLSGRRVPGALVPALGLFLIVVVSTLTTTPGFTAPWTTPIVLILAIAGLILARRRLRELTIDLWQVALALVLYAVFAAPVVLSGQATFLGYFVDGDTAFHLAIASQLASNGHNLSNVPIIPFSSIQILLQEYLGSPYPVGHRRRSRGAAPAGRAGPGVDLPAVPGGHHGAGRPGAGRAASRRGRAIAPCER